MSIKKKISIMLIMSIALIMLIANSVQASSFVLSIEPSATTVAKEDTVTLTIKLSDIDAGDGIYNLSTVIDYDTDVFETITEDDITITSSDSWAKTYSSENQKLLLENANYVSSDTEVATITFTVKSSTEANEATITLSEITAADSEGEISIADVSTKLTITDATIIISGNSTNTTNVIENATDQNFINEVENLISNENTSSNEDVPYTGAEDYIVPFISVVIVLGIVSFINYKKIDAKEKIK